MWHRIIQESIEYEMLVDFNNRLIVRGYIITFAKNILSDVHVFALSARNYSVSTNNSIFELLLYKVHPYNLYHIHNESLRI